VGRKTLTQSINRAPLLTKLSPLFVA